jgi:multiple sugar transport system substrate-binding protein
MAEIAKILTVDANGNDATSPDFDPENIVQFGYHPTWTDARGQATFFGAANFVDAEGNAVMPDDLAQGIQPHLPGHLDRITFSRTAAMSTATCWPRATPLAPARWR